MAGNDILPIYQNSTSSASAPLPSSTKAFMAKIADSGKALLARQRPWSEALDRNSFTRPQSIDDAAGRLKQNVSYFRMNYAVVSAAIVFLGLLWHPGSLIILLLLSAAWFYFYVARTEPVLLLGREFGEREVAAVLAVITFAAIFFTSTGSTILTSLLMAAALVTVHAAFRTPDDLFLDEPFNAAQKSAGYHPLTSV